MYRLNENLKVGQLDKLFKNDIVGKRFKKMVVEGNIHRLSSDANKLKFILYDVCGINLNQKAKPNYINESNIVQVIQQDLFR